ncbi:hypothetical protein D3C81_2214350 [compost metagenome]
MKHTMDSTQIQRGTSGYQKPMYNPKAVMSARQTMIISKAYVQPVRKPATGPR